MCATAVAPSCGPTAAIVACFVPTAPWPVRQCRLKTRLPVAVHDCRRNVPRLAGKHLEHFIGVVDSAYRIACRVVRSDPGSCSHLDRGFDLDGRGMHSQQQALRAHALPLHRPLLSCDDRACARPWLDFVGHLRVDCEIDNDLPSKHKFLLLK
jgi:hypothetical protein